MKTLCKIAVIQYSLEQSGLPHDIRSGKSSSYQTPYTRGDASAVQGLLPPGLLVKTYRLVQIQATF